MPFAPPPLLPRRGARSPHRPVQLWALATLVAVLLAAAAPWAYCGLIGPRDGRADRDGGEGTWVATTVRNAGSVLSEGVETATDLITR